MSLRIRLSVMVTLLFVSGTLLGMGYLVSSAKQRVVDEIESTSTLAYQLINAVLSNAEGSPGVSDQSGFLERLLEIEDARHLDISIQNPDSEAVDSAPRNEGVGAPAWFVRLVRPASLEFRRPLNNASGDVIVIRANPADEIAEVWGESRNFMLVLLLVLLFLNSILYIIIGRWLKPVEQIVEGLDEVERGDFSGIEPRASLPELRLIIAKLNSLAAVLRDSKDENNRLAKRSLLIQEEERRHLARELHDEMGQSISAIKAIAFSIKERTSGLDEKSSTGAEKIVSVSNHVRDHVRSMMSKLRPAILDELGLIPALQQMVDQWNDTHDDIFCSFKADDRFEQLSAERKINIYRIVQEALTNAARHSSATEVQVELILAERYHLRVKDNGIGFDPASRSQGLGLSGIRERARALNASCDITTSPGSGVAIDVSFATD